MGWILVVSAIAGLVYIPAVLTGDQGGWRQVRHHGGFDGTDVTDWEETDWEETDWDEIDVDEPFATTPGWEVDSSAATEADFHVLVGAGGSGGNTYQLFSCEGIPGEFDANGDFKVNITGTEDCTLYSTIPALDGSCCAAQEAMVDGGFFNTVLSFPGFDTQEVGFLVGPPGSVFPNDLGSGNHLSSWYEFLTFIFVASTYDVSLGRVQVYERTPAGSWTAVTSVPCNSPFDNEHWGQVSDPDGENTFISCNNGSSVEVSKVSLADNTIVWTHPFDTSAVPPTEFVYFQCDYTEGVRFPDGTTGDALGCTSPHDTGTDVCLFGPVDGLNPPQYEQCVTIPGIVPDRQAFEVDGQMINYFVPDPDGQGSWFVQINCGGLAQPCTTQVYENNNRNVAFSSTAPNTAIVQGQSVDVISDRFLIVLGEGTNAISLSAVDVPMVHHGHETGDLSQWFFSAGASNLVSMSDTDVPAAQQERETVDDPSEVRQESP